VYDEENKQIRLENVVIIPEPVTIGLFMTAGLTLLAIYRRRTFS